VKIEVIDTVGAGDTFQAAMLTALAERELLTPQALRSLPLAALREVLDFAGRAAAITCSRRGADLPRRAELA
jgi:fructokinase